MSWRYQPVWFDDGVSKAFALIEVFFDENGELDGWTADPHAAIGEDIEDLGAELARMVMDAKCWRPVAYKDLKPGFQFEALVSMEEREALADFVDAVGDDIGKYAAKVPQ
jgi:hypothetical protein